MTACGDADDMRQEGQRRPEAVIHHLIDEAARGREKATDLPARIVEQPGRRPALRAAHDRRIAMIAADPLELARNQIERLVPRHRHERLAAASFAVAAAMFQPAFAHHRLRDPRFRMHRLRNGVDQMRRIGIFLERPHADNPPPSTSAKNAPQCE